MQEQTRLVRPRAVYVNLFGPDALESSAVSGGDIQQAPPEVAETDHPSVLETMLVDDRGLMI
jgi:hypothetical protein